MDDTVHTSVTPCTFASTRVRLCKRRSGRGGGLGPNILGVSHDSLAVGEKECFALGEGDVAIQLRAIIDLGLA